MKKITKKIISMILAIAFIFSVTQFDVSAASTYTINGVSVSVNSFSSSPDECWTYANNLYNKIWGQRFTNSFSDSNNSLRNLSDSQLTLTEEHLKAYVSNAALGSSLRICNSDYLHGTDGWGHSQIIVQKDSKGFTVLQGGLSAYPYKNEKYYTWSGYCSSWNYDYIKYIKWPGAPAYSTQPAITTTPTISSAKTVYSVGETVTLKRNTVADTNFYQLIVWYGGKQILSTKMSNSTYTLSGLEKGTYEVYLQVGNSTSGTITSSPYIFNVSESISDVPVIVSNKKEYDIGETVTLKRNTVDNTNFYQVIVWYNGAQLVSTKMPNTTYTLSDLKKGEYAVYLQVGNAISGTITSNMYVFTVGHPMTFELQGGNVGEAIAAYTVSAFNTTRQVGALNIYNIAGTQTGTKQYGMEAAVDSTGKVTAIRAYKSTTQLTVPQGGFIVSGHLDSSAGTGNSGYYFVNKLEVGDYVYCDYPNKKVYAYESQDAYLVNHMLVDIGSKYGTLPTPEREGYTFNGWYTNSTGGTLVTSSSIASNKVLYAQWTKEVNCDQGHSWDSGAITKAATCTATGVKTYTCTTCKTTKTETITALGHSYSTSWTTDKAATCTAEGSKSQHCTRSGCTAKTNVTTIAKTAHKYDSGKITTVATAQKPGVKTFTCTVCKATKTESVPYTGSTTKGKSVERIWGASRYKTSLAIADELKAELGISKFSTVIIASGTNFPDALAGSYLAAKTDAPILMVRDNVGDIALVQNYISKNVKSGGKVYILGGTAAVPESIEKNLNSKGYDVERLKGKGRYDTNLEILKEAGVNNEAILVCTGTNFADSLSASAAGLPILLVDPNTNTLTATQIVFLDDKKREIYIIGGTGAVSDTYLNALKQYDSNSTVERVKGKSRYETSVEVAKKFCGTPSEVVIASATNFPDGLCGGPLAYFMDAPLILTGTNTSPAASYVDGKNISEGKALGGSGALADDVVRAVFGMDTSDKISGTRYN